MQQLTKKCRGCRAQPHGFTPRKSFSFPIKVLGQAFFKKLAGVGGAHGFNSKIMHMGRNPH